MHDDICVTISQCLPKSNTSAIAPPILVLSVRIPLKPLFTVFQDVSASTCLLLASNGQLNTQILVAERTRHQTKATAKAVRQRGQSSYIVKPLKDDPSLREALVKRLSNIVPTTDKMNATTGVDRRVRHTGSFTSASQPSDTRNKNKTALRVASASVSPLFYKLNSRLMFIGRKLLHFDDNFFHQDRKSVV